MNEALKIHLLKSVGRDEDMREVLLECLNRTEAEFCGFYSGLKSAIAYILCESRELETLVPEIRDKLISSYCMFTNSSCNEAVADCKLFFLREKSNVAYLIGAARIESYFLVPIALGSKVRGVLFLGSMRKEAFGEKEIAEFRSLASEGEEKFSMPYRLAGNKDLLEKLLSAIPYGAALVSSEGRIVSTNAAFAKALHLGDEVPGTIFELSVLSAFNLEGLWEEFSILKRDLLERELIGFRRRDLGLSISWVHLEGFAQDVSSLIVARDVSYERERSEMREEFMAIVAHELRTPLAALKSNLAIVGESLDSQSSDDVSSYRKARIEASSKRFISSAIRTVERLSTLVDGLIDSSSIRIDSRPLRIDLCDVDLFLEEAVSIFVEPMRRKGIEFSKFVSPETRELAFDRDRIEQILQNLLANSLKHVPEGGSVTITVVPSYRFDFVSIPPTLTEITGSLSFADLCVRDTGIGIPSNIAKNINEFDAGVSDASKGHKGLGLHVAQRLASLHGGFLQIEEATVGGSSVHLYLPSTEKTARIVRAYRTAGIRFEEMMSKGFMPEVHFIMKHDDLPWENLLEDAPGGAVMDPSRAERQQGRLFVWPVDSCIALAISERGYGQVSLNGDCSIGTAAAPTDGLNFAELLCASIERAKHAREEIFASKGEKR